jgi:hypothetical protein
MDRCQWFCELGPMAISARAMLVDLDGVLIAVDRAKADGKQELLKVHENLQSVIWALKIPVCILTHRSKKEAGHILKALNMKRSDFESVFTANDLLLSAVKTGAFFSLFKDGLRKSLILPTVEKNLGIHRRNLVFIDDRPENLDDMEQNGIGLTILAPGAKRTKTGMVVFELEKVANHIKSWNRSLPAAEKPTQRVMLKAIQKPFSKWRCTGIFLPERDQSYFGRLRQASKRYRRFFQNPC